MAEEDDGYLLATIVITKTLTDDDVRVAVTVEDPEGDSIALVDALGMIEMAKDSLLHAPADDDDD
ncbi:MAG: hypothetical protein JWO46_2797 [Nocardioidaceae bacterium]|nr:hypothetical protein [Nocardioidaceae bacterium]